MGASSVLPSCSVLLLVVGLILPPTAVVGGHEPRGSRRFSGTSVLAPKSLPSRPASLVCASLRFIS